MPRVPPVFVSHGAGALARGEGRADFAEWAKALPRPRGVLVVSAHWQTTALARGSTASRPRIEADAAAHASDARTSYGAPGAPDLAYELASLVPVERSDRGWDEGVWAPLAAMYPEADVPVLQLSLVLGATPRQAYALGRRIGVLAERGYLVMGSGNVTGGDLPEDAARELDAFFANALADADVETVLAWRTKAPHARRAHATSEHLDPLFVVLGAASLYENAVGFPVRGFERGSVSRRCVQFGR